MSESITETQEHLTTRPTRLEAPVFIGKVWQALKSRPEVPLLILLAGVLNIWALDQNAGPTSTTAPRSAR